MQLTIFGRQVSVRNVDPPSSVCGCQFISDGFPSTQRRRIIATFFNIRWVYDRAWRTGFLMKMTKMGDPRRFTEWLSSCFKYRTARVRVSDSIGPSRTFKEGLPHGSDIPLLHFTIYIGDLLAEFVMDALVSTYAGDLWIAHSATNKNMIVASTKQEVDNVFAWSDKARFTLSHPNVWQPSSACTVQKRPGN